MSRVSQPAVAAAGSGGIDDSTGGGSEACLVSESPAALTLVRSWLPWEGVKRAGTTENYDTAVIEVTRDLVAQLNDKWCDRFTTDQVAGMFSDSKARLRYSGVTSAWCAARYADQRFAALERVAGRAAHAAASLGASGFVVNNCARDSARCGALQLPAPGVLFLCSHNAGRSIMAEAFLAALVSGGGGLGSGPASGSTGSGSGWVAFSGGSTPARQVNPAVVEAMAEVGLCVAQLHPKPWTEEIARCVDLVVTMGNDRFPIVPSQARQNWAIEDTHGADLAKVRKIRDQIHERVVKLLQVEPPTAPSVDSAE